MFYKCYCYLKFLRLSIFVQVKINIYTNNFYINFLVNTGFESMYVEPFQVSGGTAYSIDVGIYIKATYLHLHYFVPTARSIKIR